MNAVKDFVLMILDFMLATTSKTLGFDDLIEVVAQLIPKGLSVDTGLLMRFHKAPTAIAPACQAGQGERAVQL